MKTRLWIALSAVLLLVCSLLALSFIIQTPHAGETHRRGACACNLREIGLALLEYRKEKGHFPPPVIKDSSSGCSHSWRVEILPYLGRSDLYDRYSFAEPWNSNANLQVIQAWPPVFVCPSSYGILFGCTNYLMLVPDTAADKGPCDEDSIGDKVIVVEVKGANIHWAEPRDVRSSEMSCQINDRSRISISSDHPGGAHIVYCNGLVEFVEDTMSPSGDTRLISDAGIKLCVP